MESQALKIYIGMILLHHGDPMLCAFGVFVSCVFLAVFLTNFDELL